MIETLTVLSEYLPNHKQKIQEVSAQHERTDNPHGGTYVPIAHRIAHRLAIRSSTVGRKSYLRLEREGFRVASRCNMGVPL